MAGKGKGKRLTDSERMEIIASLEDPSTQTSKATCARQYGVSPAAISKLMKVRQSVKKRYSDAGSDSGGFRDKRQRGGFSKNVAFEDELYRWICSIKARKVPLLVSHVQQKAKILSSRHKMNESGFKASNGWYYRFCGRYGLTPASLHAGASLQLSTVAGETKCEATQEWKELRDKLQQFGPEFVYTVTEARVFYQLLPRALEVVEEHTGTGTAATGMEKNGLLVTPGKLKRVLVLLCVNGTGTHKIPLLVVGKEKAPTCLAALRPQLLRDDGVYAGIGMGTTYYSQREVWCDERTFKHWCERVFLPAVRQRTTQPVVLVAENPGGRLAGFQQENVFTMFLPLRTGNGSDEGSHVGAGCSDGSIPAQFQLPHGVVVRDLKRRYKIGLFQERLSFLETPDEEKYRLIQRAAKKTMGTAGVALGRAPHLLDAMRLLDEAWTATSPVVIQNGWIKSSLGMNSVLSSQVPVMRTLEQRDEAIVMEFCSMLRNMNIIDDMNKLAKDVRHWLYVDDDSSEQMQQELLHDIQQLLNEEEQQQKSGEHLSPPQQMEFQLQQQNAGPFMDATDLPTAFEPNEPGSYVYRDRATAVPTVDSTVALEEKCKSIDLALQALSRAEEALDNVAVGDFFGDEAAGQAMENISRALRRLRRIQRGKQSALVAAAVNAAATGDANDSTSGALSTHEYFYGNGALGRNS